MSAKSKTASRKKSRASRTTAPSFRLWREVGGLVLLCLALVILLALLSFRPEDLGAGRDPSNLIGPVGVHVAAALLSIFGIGAFFINALLWFLGAALLLGKTIEARGIEVTGQILFVGAGTVLGHLALHSHDILGHSAGGWIGSFFGDLLSALFGSVGASILASATLVVGIVLVTGMSPGGIARGLLGIFHRFMAWVRHRVEVRRQFRARYAEEREKLLAEEGLTIEEQARREAELSVQPLAPARYDFEENLDEEVDRKVRGRLARLFGSRLRHSSPAADAPSTAPDHGKKSSKSDKPDESGTSAAEDDDEWELGELSVTEEEIRPEPIPIQGLDDSGGDHNDHDDDDDEEVIEVSDTQVIDMRSENEPEMLHGDDACFGPQIVESEATRKSRQRQELLADDDDGVLFKPQRKGNYDLPPLSFLNFDRNDDVAVDGDALRQMAAQIEQTLADFRVEGSIVEICPGPVITMFEFSPAPGVKISKIANLSDDLAMALAARSVRIVAPIPGKGVVGIEVPNPKREMVYLKEIIADEAFMENHKAILPMALGKNTEGGPVVADLAKMPHLLVAGATGAGKSVAVNTMICSLLYKHTPDDVRLIMVDPKMLEFSIYADIPHLLLPVVTDPKQATVALNWTVQEMERRYQALADMGVRNIAGYNQKVEKLSKQAELDQLNGMEDSKALSALGIDHNGEPSHRHLPYIVVIIDEFADLMMTASKDVETAVARLAQKARAAGIHLILATQRPSTDVITGLIKANFPTRLALRVTSKTDSRVVLDANGAENLLGNGDMLFVPPGTSFLQRTHGAYVSEKEIDQIVDFLRDQGEPAYNDEILTEEHDEDDGGLPEMEKDEFYEDAVRLVVDRNRASISMLQRKLRVGYNRAARMVEIMEQEGIVSTSDGCKAREVLVEESPY